MFEVWQAFTFEYVKVSEHEFFDDAQDAVMGILNDDPYANVQVIDTDAN